MAFILPNLKSTFRVIVLIWYFYCIFSLKSTSRYKIFYIISSKISKYLTSFLRYALFPKKITSAFLVLIVISLTLSWWSTFLYSFFLSPDLQLICPGQMHIDMRLCCLPKSVGFENHHTGHNFFKNKVKLRSKTAKAHFLHHLFAPMRPFSFWRIWEHSRLKNS